MGNAKDHLKDLQDLQKWMDEPIIRMKEGVEGELYFWWVPSIIKGSVRVNITANNHRCWRHTWFEILDQYPHKDSISNNQLRAFFENHLDKDKRKEDDIIALRQSVVQDKVSELAKTGQLTGIGRFFYKFANPSAWGEGYSPKLFFKEDKEND